MAVDIETVRLLIGDDDASEPLLNDAQIAALETVYGSHLLLVAAGAAEAIAAKFARKVDSAVGDVRASNSQKHKHYAELAAQLRRQALIGGGLVVYAGGISHSDKETVEDDTDRVQPAFTRELHSAPGHTRPETNELP